MAGYRAERLDLAVATLLACMVSGREKHTGKTLARKSDCLLGGMNCAWMYVPYDVQDFGHGVGSHD